ncbi:MAG: helix-hairpin-helix domain-containing protein [Terrimicrobiaceae bacterium]
MLFRPILLLVFLALLPRASAEEELKRIEGCRLVPTEWADGDSFRARFPDGTEQTIRLYGADCIEWHVNDESDARRLRTQRRYFGIADGEPGASIAQAKGFGEAAAVRTRELLAKPFTIHTAFADGRGDSKFGRIYAFVTTPDGQDLSAVLVREGLARAFGVSRRLPDGGSAQEYRQQLQDLELTAASARSGIWAKTDWTRLAGDRQTERREEQEISAAFTKSPPPDGSNPNTASRDELMLLPGVGEVLANRIIEGRSDGPYAGPKDLLRVKGISPKTLEAMTASLRFTKAPASADSPRP